MLETRRSGSAQVGLAFRQGLMWGLLACCGQLGLLGVTYAEAQVGDTSSFALFVLLSLTGLGLSAIVLYSFWSAGWRTRRRGSSTGVGMLSGLVAGLVAAGQLLLTSAILFNYAAPLYRLLSKSGASPFRLPPLDATSTASTLIGYGVTGAFIALLAILLEERTTRNARSA